MAAGGRTILFVSHNMSAVGQLCRTGIILETGTTAGSLPIREAIDSYMKMGNSQDQMGLYVLPFDSIPPQGFTKIAIGQGGVYGRAAVLHDQSIDVEFSLRFRETVSRPVKLSIAVCDRNHGRSSPVNT